ncbi:MAG: type pilus assembly protein PilM [Solirubrobacterales bacterium]|jgi:type IV pilus assembly protein PilM|nr:type pilus assembly protein PilM [Solirubrobacterales bacterium]
MISIKKKSLMQPRHRAEQAVGLDIEAGSVAATELSVNGAVSVQGFGVAALPAGAVRDGEVHDAEVVGAALKELFAAHKLPREVRIGIANQRVAVRTIRLPQIDNRDELASAVRFAAQDHIPMPLDRAVLDWQLIPKAPEDETPGLEVVAVAARREMLETLLDAVNHAGLRPVGIDHSSFALIRALAGKSVPAAAATAEVAEGATTAGQLYCHLGDITNLAVARESYCVFSRVLGFGIEGIAQSLSASSSLTLEHARQWLLHVGLEAPVEEIEGDAGLVTATRDSLTAGTATLVDELRRSVEYYAAAEDAVSLDAIILAGPGCAIPGLVARLDGDLPLPVRRGVPAPLSSAAGPAADRLTLSYGLGLEE